MNKTALVIAAHPDDETLGMGGTWFKLKSEGWKVALVWMTDGSSSRDDNNLEVRNSEVETVLSLLKPDDFHHFNFPDNKMDTIAILDIVKTLEPIIDNLKPSRIYTHTKLDLNIDHQVVHNAVITAARPLPNRSVQLILGFEVLSATHWHSHSNFQPQWHVDVEGFTDKKYDVLKAYKNEMNAFPSARSLETVKSLEVFRGSLVGRQKAESFEIYRSIE